MPRGGRLLAGPVDRLWTEAMYPVHWSTVDRDAGVAARHGGAPWVGVASSRQRRCGARRREGRATGRGACDGEGRARLRRDGGRPRQNSGGGTSAARRIAQRKRGDELRAATRSTRRGESCPGLTTVADCGKDGNGGGGSASRRARSWAAGHCRGG